MSNLLKIIVSIYLFTFSQILWAKPIPVVSTPSFMTLKGISESPLGFGAFNIKAYTFNASKGNEAIYKYYKKLWKGKIKTTETPAWYYHTNFDGKYLTSVQVRKESVTSFNKNTSASGLISISEPGAIKKKDIVNVETFYPMSSGTHKLTDISATDLGKQSRTTVFDRPGSVLQNLEHYKRYFKQKGWIESQKEMAEAMVKDFDASTLFMQQGSNELIVSFIPDNNRTKVVSVLVKQ